MVNINNNFNVIPWYSALKQQNHKKWYAFGNKWPLIMPNTKFLPFQFILESFPTSVGNIIVHSLDTQNAIDLGITPIVIQNTEKGYCVVMLPPNACALASALPVGQYYATLSLDDITLYSEVFTAVDNIEKYLKITYWSDEALYYKSGEINYSNDFRYELYLDASIGKPEYEFSEELTTRLGYKFLESQISNKLYKFIFLGPEFICDAMRLIRLSDYIKIESASDSYNAISFAYEPNWETQGDLASIEVSFETDTIIQKLPSFNRSQRENFYNALLASTAEPLLFDEGVIAQYYTAFSESIAGKLIRQLADISVEEITENTVIPVDQGTGAAQRVKLLNLLKRYGGKGLDEEALANYLVNNSYATQAWVRQQEYAKQRDIDSILDWFELRTLESGTKILFTKYTLVSALDQIAGGVGEGGSSSSGAAYNRLDTWENYNENAGDVLSAKLGYDLKQQIEQLQQSGGSGESVIANITVKIGNAEYTAVDGVVSLPAYPTVPTVPTKLSELIDDLVAGNYLPLTGGILSGALSVPNINITSADAIAHLAFGRQGGNIITAPSGGYFTFIPGGKSVATANADLVITDGIVYPGTTGVTKLGFGGKRWSQVSSVDGDFSGALTAGTFSTANVVSCGGRLRINASNSVNSFGFLKATAYTTSLNRAVLNIGSNYGGSSDIASEAVDVVAMSIYRGAVGVGRAFTYDELYANKNNNVMLSVEGNINNVGDIVSTGEQVAGSDMRYKIVKSKFRLSSAIIAHAPLFRFQWKNHKTTKLKIGTSAQYWEEFAPELVTFDSVSDFKHLNYAGLGVAIGISNAREIEQLKKEIVSLKERLANYEHN